MRKAEGLIVGSVQSSLGQLIHDEFAVLKALPFVLLCSIDSEIALSSAPIGRRILDKYPACKFLGAGIVVPNALLFDNSLNLFHGFDEAWFFSKEPLVQKPSDGWLVGPLDLNLKQLPPSLLPWIASSCCKLGLGDGTVLNFVTGDEEIARAIDQA